MPLHPEVELTIKLDNITGNHENDRNALRTLLLDKLVEEKAGTGNKEKTSKYRYNVENLPCGNRVYLRMKKPEALLERIILACSKENDILLVPFCGSTTTGVTA